ncbi:hypothetical protein A3762_14070 [Oleiphilus sp. HI0125]|nr:hypothetical protein A3762_14070 [Oleiphilus sp. HI0125]
MVVQTVLGVNLFILCATHLVRRGWLVPTKKNLDAYNPISKDQSLRVKIGIKRGLFEPKASPAAPI